jgi:hypothetical protein
LFLLSLSLIRLHHTNMMIPVQDGRTSNDRIAEVAGILAVGLQRLTARQSSDLSADRGESSLHISPDQSGDAPTSSAGVSNG